MFPLAPVVASSAAIHRIHGAAARSPNRSVGVAHVDPLDDIDRATTPRLPSFQVCSENLTAKGGKAAKIETRNHFDPPTRLL